MPSAEQPEFDRRKLYDIRKRRDLFMKRLAEASTQHDSGVAQDDINALSAFFFRTNNLLPTNQQQKLPELSPAAQQLYWTLYKEMDKAARNKKRENQRQRRRKRSAQQKAAKEAGVRSLGAQKSNETAKQNRIEKQGRRIDARVKHMGKALKGLDLDVQPKMEGVSK